MQADRKPDSAHPAHPVPHPVIRHIEDPAPSVIGQVQKRLRALAAVIVVAGLVTAAVGAFYVLPQADDGLASAQAIYAEEGVRLSYNAEGKLIDRGTPEGAQKILDMLETDWKYPVKASNFDPNDPVINTRDELMYQYATITYHVLHTTVAVKLAAADVPITYRGVTYNEAGTYNITVEKYYGQLDRTNPIERQLRDAWSPLALALTGALAGAHANQAAGELAQGVAYFAMAVGGLVVFIGVGLFWVAAPSAPRRTA